MDKVNQSGLRVLVLGDSRSFHIERYVAAMKAQGCHVLLASLERGGTHHFALKHRGFIGALHYVLASSELFGLVKRFSPHIINPHFASGYGFTTALSRVRQVAPVMLHLWGSDILVVPNKSILHRKKTAYSLSHSDFLLADSKFIIERAARIAKLPETRVIPWGVDKVQLDHHKNDYTLSTPAKIIVPRPHEQVYNNAFLIRALAPMVNNKSLMITFPSWGTYSGDFKKLATELTEGKISYYDRMDRDKFTTFVSSFDICLSGAISDSSPASMLEAMGLGLIPVAADIPGVREWLTLESGYLYDPVQPIQLRETIAKLIEKGDHKEMRQRNLARIQREAIFETNIEETIKIMRQLIKDKQASRKKH